VVTVNGRVAIRVLMVVSLVAASLITRRLAAGADELVSADQNWRDVSSRAACNKSKVHTGSVAESGKGYSWVTNTASDCDATKVSAYSLSRVVVYSNDTDPPYGTYACDMVTRNWSTTTVRIAAIGYTICPSGYEDLYGSSSAGSCVSGDCAWSSLGSCPYETSTWPPPAGYVYKTCTYTDDFPALSGPHARS